MQDKKLIYINLALVLGLVFTAVVILKTMHRASEESGAVRDIGAEKVRKTAARKIEEPSYDIGKIKGEEARPAISETPKNLADVYKAFPERDAGDNMIEGWSRVDLKEKAKLMEALDGEIAASSGILKTSPEDKKARHMLFISETLKKLASSDFDYEMKKPGSSTN